MSTAQGAARGRLPRDSLLVLLALATGATDAAAFERLGHVFASVITGNLILLGIGVVKDDNCWGCWRLPAAQPGPSRDCSAA